MSLPRYGIGPGQKRASALSPGTKIIAPNGDIVTLTNVVVHNSGGGLGCTDLYWTGGKSGGASERPVTLASEDLSNFIQTLDV